MAIAFAPPARLRLRREEIVSAEPFAAMLVTDGDGDSVLVVNTRVAATCGALALVVAWADATRLDGVRLALLDA